MEKGKKIKLHYTHEHNYSLIAISTSLNDYHFSWNINQKLGINLVKKDDILVAEGSLTEGKAYSVYHCTDEMDMLDYTLISNKSEHGPLIKDIQHIDYFFRVAGSYLQDAEQKILPAIKDIDQVMMAYKLNYELLGTRNKNIFLGIFELFD